MASGTIIRYEPEEKVALGSTVTLYVSTGPEEEFVPVPNLYGKTDAEAAALLSAAGLVTGEVSKGVRQHDLGRSRHQSGR